MAITMKQIEDLKCRRRIAMDHGAELTERPTTDLIRHMTNGSRMPRLLRDYATVGDVLQADIADLIGIPGMATSTVIAIQNGVEALIAELRSTPRRSDHPLQSCEPGMTHFADDSVATRIDDMLASPNGGIDDAEVESLISEILRPVNTGTAAEIATLAGGNARDRQSLKRKASRWGEMFARLPPLERLMVLRAMANTTTRDTDATTPAAR